MSRFLKILTVIAVSLMTVPAFASIQISYDPAKFGAEQIVTAVTNNSTSAMTSGTVVIWDTAGTAGTTLGSYVTTTTTADSALVAGVVLSDSIAASGGVGHIVVRGPVQVRFAEVTDGATEAAGDVLGTTTVAGQAGVGSRLGVRLQGAVAGSSNNELVWVFVDCTNS